MDIEEIFSQIIRYYPEGDDKNAYQNMLEYACASLSAGNFAEAQKYSDMVINGNAENSQVISAIYIMLFIKLNCRNEEEFNHCDKFNTQMPEYMALLQACSADRAQLKKLSDLTENNSRTVAADIAAARAKEEAAMRERQAALRAETERKAREEEKRKARMALAESEMRQYKARLRREEQKRRAQEQIEKKFKQYTIPFVVLACAGILLFLTGIVLWAVFGNVMSYRMPLLWLFFLLSFVLFLAAFILSFSARRMYKMTADEYLAANNIEKSDSKN